MARPQGIISVISNIYEAVGGIGGWKSFLGLGKKEHIAEAPLTQQMTTVLPSLNDEAIQAALDAVLSKDQLKRVQMVRDILETHQLSRWRKTIGTLELTEKFEDVVTSEKTIKTSKGGNEREETTRTSDRRKRDYEYTAEDPRVKHLHLVATIVVINIKTIRGKRKKVVDESSIKKAKEYLIKAGMILEKSHATQVKEQVTEAREKVSDLAYHGAVKMTLGRRYKENMSARRQNALLARRDCAQRRLFRRVRANRFPHRHININGFNVGRHINIRGFNVVVPRGRLLAACIGILISASIIIATIIVAS